MALDGGFIACLAAELRETLKDSRVDKIHQPSREELLLSLRSKSISIINTARPQKELIPSP